MRLLILNLQELFVNNKVMLVLIILVEKDFVLIL